MKIKDILDKLDDMKLSERDEVLKKLIPYFSPPSMTELVLLAMKHGTIQQENAEIKHYIHMELSELGQRIRMRSNLPLLDMESDI
jgi:hypothetical protein